MKRLSVVLVLAAVLLLITYQDSPPPGETPQVEASIETPVVPLLEQAPLLAPVADVAVTAPPLEGKAQKTEITPAPREIELVDVEPVDVMDQQEAQFWAEVAIFEDMIARAGPPQTPEQDAQKAAVFVDYLRDSGLSPQLVSLFEEAVLHELRERQRSPVMEGTEDNLVATRLVMFVSNPANVEVLLERRPESVDELARIMDELKPPIRQPVFVDGQELLRQAAQRGIVVEKTVVAP